MALAGFSIRSTIYRGEVKQSVEDSLYFPSNIINHNRNKRS